ncbi:MAG: MarR family winged helix-turn-helix transcriptional regulator [Betaproteobacteria bacterium]
MKPRSPAKPESSPSIDSSPLQGLVGYAARRASMVLSDSFVRHLAPLNLRPVPFTLLSLIGATPGITSTQLCALLDIQSSNLVGLVKQLQERELIMRQPHPEDGRAHGLHLTPAGRTFLEQASAMAAQADRQATAALSDAEVKKLLQLLSKIHGL